MRYFSKAKNRRQRQTVRFTRPQQLVLMLLIGLGIALGGLVLGTDPAQAQSGPQTWFLEAVRYDTGATASGSFKYDADTDTYSEINIIISGSPVNGTNNTYTFLNPISSGNDSFMPAVTEVRSNMFGVKAMTLSFASALTNAGGTVEILPGQTNPSYQGTCNFNCQLINGPYDLVVTGRVTTGVPDNTPPNAAPTPTPFPNAAGWHNTDVTVTWNWQDNPGGSGIDTNNCPSTGASSGEGTIPITGTCNDLAGNIGNASYTVQVDKTAPETTFSVQPNIDINNVDPFFEFGGSDTLSGVASFECQLNDGGWSPCTSPHSYTNLFGSNPITHIFEARAIDVAGNVDPTPISYTWLTNPQPAFIRIIQDTVPDGPTDFTYNATHDTNSFVPGTFFLDDDADGTLSNIARFSELVKGTYIFTQTVPSGYGPPAISCTDPSGGTSVSGNVATLHALFGETLECTFTNNLTDITPPTASPTQSPIPNPAGWNNTDVTVTWNWTDNPGGTGIDPNSCPASDTITLEGSFTLTPTCQDLGGNQGGTQLTVQVDKTVPDTTITSNPPATSNTADATFEFSGSDALSGVASLECQLDGGGYSPCTSPQTYTGLANGSHTFEVRSIDVADNVDASPASYTWTVDIPPADTTPPTAAPTQSPAANLAFWNNTDVTITWNWADEAGGSGIDANNCTTSSISSGEGSLNLTASCTDLAGNAGSANYAVQVDTTAPDTTITANPPATSSSADATFEFSGSDALSGVASLECQLDGGGYSACTSPQTYTGLANGSHTFEVRSIDLADNVDASSASYTWTVDTQIFLPFVTCGGHDIFETSPGVYEAPSFAGNLIVGTNGKDTLDGTDGADLIVGLDMADDIQAKKGPDIVCGGKGSDIIGGGRGADTLYGGKGSDILKGNRGKDTLFGEGGKDTLEGGRGNDNLFGNGGDDTLDGGQDNDDCNGGGGTDTAQRCEVVSSVP